MLTLAHLSDPHIGPLPRVRARDIAGKPGLGWLNWQRGRRDIHRMDVLDALLRDVADQQPDHIAVTGDIVNLALPGEYPAGRAFLERIGPPDRVSLVPGNHDAYTVKGARRLLEAFDPYMRGDDAGAHPLDEDHRFPYIRVRDGVALIGLSTAVPTGLFMATGKLGLRQISKLRQILPHLEHEGLTRVVLLHHPVRRQDAGPMAMLVDCDQLRAVLREFGAELVLHGHIHRDSMHRIKGPSGTIPVVCVPSASAAPERARWPAAYNLFSFKRTSSGLVIHHSLRGFMSPGHGIELIREQTL